MQAQGDDMLLDQLRNDFAAAYGRPPVAVGEAPGRLELLGNHTDYNEGFVLSCAIDRSTLVAVAPAPGPTCRLRSREFRGETSFSIADIGNARKGDWTNYIKGVILELRKRGCPVPAFDAMLTSTVPLSAGMSSSAALEVAAAFALGKLANASFSNADWARIGQGAENNYVGARTGLLDQFTSINGKHNHVVFSDFRSLDVKVRQAPEDAVFVVANTGVKHDLTSEYNERRSSCEKAAATLAGIYPHVKTLRDVTRAQLEAARDRLDVLAYRRACHIVGEDERVHAGLKALETGDLAAFGRLMNESHESSRRNFENSCPELDILVELGQSLPGCYGSRLSGGGFGGIAIHLVERRQSESFCQRLGAAWKSRTRGDCHPMICAIGEGARLHV